MIARLVRIFRLSASERRMLCAAMVTIPWIAIRLRWAGLAPLRRELEGIAVSTPPRNAATHASEIARMVRIAARHGPYRAGCLPTALAVQWLLARTGIRSQLRFGVRRARGSLEAHAWVEHEGRPLIDDHGVNERFAAFDVLPERAESR